MCSRSVKKKKTTKWRNFFWFPMNSTTLLAAGSRFVFSSFTGDTGEVLTLRLLRSFMPQWAGFSHTFQPQHNVQKKRWSLCENPLPGANKQTGEEMNTSVPSFHPHTFTFYLHIPSLLLLWLIQPVGITLIIQKVTCGLLLSPLLRREEENGKRKKKKLEGVSVLILSFLAIIFFPSTSWCGELICFIHCGEKGATDHSAAEIVRQSGALCYILAGPWQKRSNMTSRVSWWR